MKNKKLNAELVWKQFEDLVVPELKLSAVDHAVYSYLLRHSHLEGKRRLHLSMYKLGRGTHLSSGGARNALRRMVKKGALKLVERSKAGHVIEVRLPEEIRRVRAKLAKENASRGPDLDRVSFWKDPGLRETIHRREGGKCFYCLKRLTLEELNGRLRALKELAAGKMRPEVKMKEIKEVKEGTSSTPAP